MACKSVYVRACVCACECSVCPCGGNRQAPPLIYGSISGHGNHQESDADEWRGKGMKNDRSDEGVRQRGTVINMRERCPFG